MSKLYNKTLIFRKLLNDKSKDHDDKGSVVVTTQKANLVIYFFFPYSSLKAVLNFLSQLKAGHKVEKNS